MPAWMRSPRGMLTAGQCTSMDSSINAPWLEGHGPLQHDNRAGAKGGSNGGLVVRGGGAAVITGGPLGGVLFATAFLSAVLERWTKAGAVVGAPLLSFATFCILSNLGLVPAKHGFYDLCWSHLLPLSLAIIILGNPVVDEKQKQNSDLDPAAIEPTAARPRGSAGPILRVGLCFLIGALGSVAGVAASFRVATTCVHMAFMAAGASMANRFFGAQLGVDDVLVASNANIGGPSTAATFAGLIGKDELVVPAAIWGTVGYAVATTLGVGVWAALR
eukprot:g18033.t1